MKTEAAPPLQSKLLSPTTVEQPKIAFFGIFGIQNLGNECTLQAILHNAREWLPGGELYSICYRPDDTSRRHNVAAIAISARYFQSRSPSGEVVQRKGGISRLLRICFQRAPGELLDWWKAIKALKGTDLVVMTGTGMLTDYSTSAFGYPFDVFKWALAARLAGCKVRFVGIGVGPIYGRLSRLFIRYALSLADYRSFRDQFSKNRIKITGYDSDKDPVFPDLAFSLPKNIFPQHSNRTRQKRQVGLGIMDHRDVHIGTLSEQESAYSAYLEKMCDFTAWLIERGYGIHILQGDVKYDRRTRADLKARLEQRGVRYDQAGIVDEDATTVEDLVAQIAEVDIVVSPRFHNLLLGLMLNIPVVSISYDPKNDALLEGIGLGKYRQPLTDLDVQKLIDQFSELEAQADAVKPMISKKASEYRTLLEKQYQLIFGGM
ncbi:MAG: polysaccharide pyruvyl transferase family protein [Terriglobales bacterium]